jgi:DNA-binding transcriptional regulator YiaG
MPHAYFLEKATEALQKAGLTDADPEPLAQWAEGLREAHRGEPDFDATFWGVVVAADGSIVAETQDSEDRCAYVVEADRKRLGLGYGILGMAISEISRAVGQEVAAFRYSALAMGPSSRAFVPKKKSGMSPVELRARRRALGLGQDGLASALGVAQNTVSTWEGGRRGIPAGLDDSIAKLEDARDDLVDRALDAISAAREAEGEPVLFIYATDQRLWDTHPETEGIPVEVHQVAMALAAAEARAEYGVRVPLVLKPRH